MQRPTAEKGVSFFLTFPHFAVPTCAAAACFQETPYTADHTVRLRHALVMDGIGYAERPHGEPETIEAAL
jgi:hypothetical protein